MTIKEAVIEVCHKIFLPPYEKKMRRRLETKLITKILDFKADQVA